MRKPMIGFCPLASGSKGNCLFLGTDQTKILIDAGISGKQINERLQQIGVSLDDIEAVMVTHEHLDHIEGLKILSGKKNIPVFANMETARGIYQNLQLLPTFKIFSTGEVFSFKDLTILPIGVQHDTLDPVGFVIEAMGIKIGICSDLGFVTTLLKKNLEHCHYLYIEANHQPSMVMASNRSALYKQRVLGRQGHLSNEDCASLIASVWHKDLRVVYLAHLSQECNSPDLAKKIIEEHLKEKSMFVDVSIAYQEKISRVVRFDVVQ
jgi:phosphoribosyl 1,2-cyclic phosphodiesterase